MELPIDIAGTVLEVERGLEQTTLRIQDDGLHGRRAYRRCELSLW
jgi:hypothetical protein